MKGVKGTETDAERKKNHRERVRQQQSERD